MGNYLYRHFLRYDQFFFLVAVTLYFRETMSRRKFKQEILSLLEQDSPKALYSQLRHYPQHILINTLFIALCNLQENVKWNAVACFGQVVPAIAEKDTESARIVMRRFLWSLNDESGGIGWGAPEAMAEIMCHSETLRQEYLHMLISYMREDGEESFQDGNYIEHPMLQRGLLWAIGRMCLEYPVDMSGNLVSPDLLAYLESSDLYVAGLAIWCLSLLDAEGPFDAVEKYLDCNLELSLFIGNTFSIVKVSDLAKNVMSAQGTN